MTKTCGVKHKRCETCGWVPIIQSSMLAGLLVFAAWRQPSKERVESISGLLTELSKHVSSVEAKIDQHLLVHENDVSDWTSKNN